MSLLNDPAFLKKASKAMLPVSRTMAERRPLQWLGVVTYKYVIYKEWMRGVFQTPGVDRVTNTEFTFDGTLYKTRFVLQPHQIYGIDPTILTVIYLEGWEQSREIRDLLSYVKTRRLKTRHLSMGDGWIP